MRKNFQVRDRVVMYGTVRKVSAEGTIVTIELDGSSVPAIIRSGAVTVEKILMDSTDWPHCVCGNMPDGDGFAPCLEDGTVVEPTVDGPWQGKLYVCNKCGRVFDQTTRVITTHAELDP